MIDYDPAELMTAEQFVEYVQQGWCYWQETYYELDSQYHSECAMFGDAGPGQGHRLREMSAELASVSRRYEELTGRLPHQDSHFE